MPARRAEPVVLLPGSAPTFPDPQRYDAEGMVAIGGDLSTARLLAAYREGIFPWYAEGLVPLWWCPDPRGVLDPAAVHVSRSLGRTLRRADFRLAWNSAFSRVMTECGRRRPGGTWILAEMLPAYGALHRLGRAHSLEVWVGQELVGGIYGVQVGGAFAAESMFHRRDDMSKVALVALCRSLAGAGVGLLDVQFVTSHLRSLGAVELPRAEYLRRLAVERDRVVDLRGLVPTLDPPAAPP